MTALCAPDGAHAMVVLATLLGAALDVGALLVLLVAPVVFGAPVVVGKGVVVAGVVLVAMVVLLELVVVAGVVLDAVAAVVLAGFELADAHPAVNRTTNTATPQRRFMCNPSMPRCNQCRPGECARLRLKVLFSGQVCARRSVATREPSAWGSRCWASAPPRATRVSHCLPGVWPRWPAWR